MNYRILETKTHLFKVIDVRTGNESTPFRSFVEAEIHLHSLNLRNLMHS